MEKEYSWQIKGMVCKPKEGDLTDVVLQANWMYRASLLDDNNKRIASVTEDGVSFFTSPDPTNYTPYSDLTEEQVKTWVIAEQDMDLLNKKMDEYLEQKMNPPVIILNLPWDK